MILSNLDRNNACDGVQSLAAFACCQSARDIIKNESTEIQFQDSTINKY